MKKTTRSGSGRRRVRFTLPPWLAVAALLCVMVPAALSQEKGPAAAATQGTGAASTDGADSGEPAPAAEPEKVTLMQMFQRGGIFMYPLALCSVLTVAIVLERFVALRRARVNPPAFLPGLRTVFRDPVRDREAAINYCRADDSALARMVGAGVRRMPLGHIAVEKAIEDAGANEAIKLRRNLRMLYAIGSVATLLGLIGTISGMIRAFQVASGGGMGKTELLSKGIYEAMVCTFAGLAVAIVTTIFYYFFVGRIERLISEMNDELDAFAEQYTDPIAISVDRDDAAANGFSAGPASYVPHVPPPAAAAYPGVPVTPGGATA